MIVSGHDLIVIGGSAGSIPALTEIVRDLPKSLPAAVCVVVHISSSADSVLPQILSRAGPLEAHTARDGEPICPGHIYVAPPDHHLLIRDGCLQLSHGPKENHTRPAVDPLFRTAAAAHDGKVVGVVLSGYLYDGSLGLAAVKEHAGVTIVLDPADASARSMPERAISTAVPDYVLPLSSIAPKLVELAWDAAALQASKPCGVTETACEQTCPDCGGVLHRFHHERTVRFSCAIGHLYEPDTLLARRSEAAEDLLWSAVRTLREEAELSTVTAQYVRDKMAGDPEALRAADQLVKRAALVETRAARIRELLEQSWVATSLEPEK